MKPSELEIKLIKANVKYELCISKLKAIQEYCETGNSLIPYIEPQDIKRIKKDCPCPISNVEVGFVMGLQEKADSIMAIIKRKEV
tara:strand:- start:442 stop:696 length:255 start_codon:yes stop_codon:yes gene_type:complete